jgi:hypothetical protein
MIFVNTTMLYCNDDGGFRPRLGEKVMGLVSNEFKMTLNNKINKGPKGQHNLMMGY